MNDDRKYRVLLKHGAGSVWVRDIRHATLIGAIQCGGLWYFNDERQQILDFQIQIQPDKKD